MMLLGWILGGLFAVGVGSAIALFGDLAQNRGLAVSVSSICMALVLVLVMAISINDSTADQLRVENRVLRAAYTEVKASGGSMDAIMVEVYEHNKDVWYKHRAKAGKVTGPFIPDFVLDIDYIGDFDPEAQ